MTIKIKKAIPTEHSKFQKVIYSSCFCNSIHIIRAETKANDVLYFMYIYIRRRAIYIWDIEMSIECIKQHNPIYIFQVMNLL